MACACVDTALSCFDTALEAAESYVGSGCGMLSWVGTCQGVLLCRCCRAHAHAHIHTNTYTHILVHVRIIPEQSPHTLCRDAYMT